MALLLTACQTNMIYHPTRYPAGAFDKVAAGHNLKPWLDGTGERIGWQQTNSAAGPTVLIVHGNAGSALDRVDFARGLSSAGPVNVFILEYPGYGERRGKPSQITLLQAATDALQLLSNRSPLFIVGESLGTGVAAYLAGHFPHAVKGLLLFCPYNNLTDVARHHTFSLVPVGLLLRDRFPSDEWLQAYSGPVGILLAGRDTIVPARFGQRLYDSYHGPKKLWVLADAGHNDVFHRPEGWWREVFQFWKQSSL